MTNRRPIVAAALLALTVLAGCSSPEPETTPNEMSDENDLSEDNVPEDEAVAPPVEAAKPEPTTPTNIIVAEPEAPVEPDAQMLDDADATGMTARITRNTGDDAAPANQD